ncbi:hypothetical protein D3C75_891080 [compost metagenome]
MAVSLLAREAIHSARQTSQLQRIPRKNSSEKGKLIFLAAAVKIRCSAGAALNNPVPRISRARTTAPATFPIKTMIQFFTVSHTLVRPARVLTVKNILFPVNSSEPAKTTSVRAIPKDVPIISG